ncbi:hypothetical protein PBI_SCTP2_130 [Salicola phage SCTP-2]|nr:hypothetical protein PBI_SCTP2_130 [Salicola phage SCTP-2]
MSKQKTQEVETQNEETQNGGEEAPNISLQDIVTARDVINAATTRGAFRAEELSTVGRLYDKINSFVKHHVPESQSNDSTQENEKGGDAE